MEVKFLLASKNRRLEFWDYTEHTWDESQADRNMNIPIRLREDASGHGDESIVE